MFTAYTVTNNETLRHFEIHESNSIAFLEYRFYKNNITFMHTEVPELREQLDKEFHD